MKYSLAALIILVSTVYSAPLKVDERPAGPGEWGFRPAEGKPGETNPPPFVWRPQRNAKEYSSDAVYGFITN